MKEMQQGFSWQLQHSTRSRHAPVSQMATAGPVGDVLEENTAAPFAG